MGLSFRGLTQTSQNHYKNILELLHVYLLDL